MTHERGREGIGILQGPGQGGKNYPLVYPSADVDQLLADAFLAYIDNTLQFARPFSIAYLYGFGTNPVTVPITPVHSHEVRVVDADGTTVFETLTVDPSNFKETAVAGRLKSLEWTDAAGQTLRIVYHTEWSPEHTPIVYDDYIEPTEAVLDGLTLYQYPRRVTAIRVGLITLSGDDLPIVVKNGFNTSLVADTTQLTDGSRRETAITFSAASGSGLGRFGGCDDALDPPILRINGEGPTDNGNFLLDASDCYRVQRPVLSVLAAGPPREVRVQSNALELANDCGPCCDCDDFIAVWEAIRRQRDRYADLIATTQAVRDQYHINRQRFLDDRACREKARLRLILQPTCPNELGIGFGYCNSTERCLKDVVLHLSFDYTDGLGTCPAVDGSGDLTALTTAGDGVLRCETVFRAGNVDPDAEKGFCGGARQARDEFYTLGGSYPHFWAHWDCIDPGTMGSVVFRMVFPDAETADRVEMIVDAFEIGSDPVFSGSSPVPGYVPGSGPLTTPPGMHLVDCPTFANTGLLNGPCCDE